MRMPGVSAFLAIVRTKSLYRAATQLNLAQSTVSKRLQTLEEEIGMTLIERGKGVRSIQLTSAGEAFVEIAERWDSLLQDMRTLRAAGPDVSLSVGTLDSVINSVFPGIYTELLRHKPKIHLKIATLHSTDAYDGIERRDVDVAFSLLELANTNVHIREAYSETMVVLRVAESNREYPKKVHSQDLDENSELYVRWGPSFQLWHDKCWRPYARGRTSLDTPQLMLSCFRLPSEWAIVPHSFAKLAQSRGNFIVQHLSDPPPERVVYLLTHRHPKANSQIAIDIFSECLDTALKKLDGIVRRK
jgi:DNA-binding transcriptional LysR family regulator